MGMKYRLLILFDIPEVVRTSFINVKPSSTKKTINIILDTLSAFLFRIKIELVIIDTPIPKLPKATRIILDIGNVISILSLYAI